MEEEETSQTGRDEISGEIGDGCLKRREGFEAVDIASPHGDIEEGHKGVPKKLMRKGELSGNSGKGGVESSTYCPPISIPSS